MSTHETLLDGIEHIQEYVLTFTLNSVLRYEAKTATSENMTIICSGDAVKSHKFVSLSTEDFSLSYTGNKLTLSAVGRNIDLDDIPAGDISEEWFFQLSTVRNFGALSYEDIELVKAIYNRKFPEV